MSPLNILFYIMTALVFLMWAISMFSAIFAMRRRAVARTGKTLPGPMDTLKEWGIWFRDPAFKHERRRLLFMTIVVLCLSYLASITANQAS